MLKYGWSSSVTWMSFATRVTQLVSILRLVLMETLAGDGVGGWSAGSFLTRFLDALEARLPGLRNSSTSCWVAEWRSTALSHASCFSWRVAAAWSCLACSDVMFFSNSARSQSSSSFSSDVNLSDFSRAARALLLLSSAFCWFS